MKITDDMLRQSAAQAREQWLDTLPQKQALPEYPVSARLESRMTALFQKSRRREKRRRALRAAGRVAAVLLLFSVFSFAGLMSVSASFRASVLQFFVRVRPEATDYYFSGGSEDAVLPELNLDALPEGFTILSDQVYRQSLRQISSINEAGNYLDIEVNVLPAIGSSTYSFDTEDAQISALEIQGKALTVISKNGWNTLIWTESSAVFTIVSDLGLSDLTPVVENLTKNP